MARSGKTRPLGLLAIALGWGGVSAPSAAAPAPAPTSTLTVVAGAGVETLTDGTGRADAGVVDPGRTPKVKRVFRLENRTGTPITVSGLRAACGCESLLLTQGGRTVTRTVLAPGQQAEVSLTIDLLRQAAGPLQKFAWVYGAGGMTTLATLEVDLTLRPAVVLSPTYLDFGTVTPGAAQTLPLSVTADADVLAGKPLPTLLSSDPAIQVVPDGSAASTRRDGRASVRQGYRVVLAAGVPTGRLSGTLSFAPAGQTGTAFRGLSMPVLAEISGPLRATPALLLFGAVPAGREATRQVVLSLAPSLQSSSLSVSSDSPWLSATVAPATNGQSGMRMLRVTLGQEAPVGALQSQIVVTFKTGDRLLIPVVAEVTPPPQQR